MCFVIAEAMLAFPLIAITALAFQTASAPEPGSTPAAGVEVGNSPEESATARLIETDDAIRIEITAPTFIFPSISIDADRNGSVQSDTDFLVSAQADGSACLSILNSNGSSSTCRPLGARAQIVKGVQGNRALTQFIFPKKAVSTDGFGFGFVIDLYNETEHYGTRLAAADYRFGGFLSPVQQLSDFKGTAIGVPPEVLPFIRRYGACLHVATDALGPLDRSKLDRLKAVRPGCWAVRADSVKKATSALIADGMPESTATPFVADVFQKADAGQDRLVDILEHGPPKPANP